jgi:hypothetical protein
MKVHRVFKRYKYKLLASIVTFSFFFALDTNFSVSAETLQKNYLDTKAKSNPTETEKNTGKISAPARSSGMKVFKDPETGEFTTTNDSSDVPSAHALEVNTSSEGLVETQAPKGGIMINLQGRFRSFMSATKDANGKLSVSCSQAHTLTTPGDVK